MTEYCCSLCKKKFEQGDLTMAYSENRYHSFPDTLGDEMDCDTVKALKKEIKGEQLEAGCLEIFANGEYHAIKAIRNLPNFKELRVTTRNDGRGSRIEGL